MAIKKGQYFIIGTVIIAGLLLGVLTANTSISSESGSVDITRSLFENSLTEFSTAVTAIVNEETTSSHIEKQIQTYMELNQHSIRQHGTELEAHFLIGLPTTNGYNITFGNFRGKTINEAWIQVNDETNHITTINDSTVTSLRFPTDKRIMKIKFNTTQRNNTFTSSRKILSFIDAKVTLEGTTWRDTQLD